MIDAVWLQLGQWMVVIMCAGCMLDWEMTKGKEWALHAWLPNRDSPGISYVRGMEVSQRERFSPYSSPFPSGQKECCAPTDTDAACPSWAQPLIPLMVKPSVK